LLVLLPNFFNVAKIVLDNLNVQNILLLLILSLFRGFLLGFDLILVVGHLNIIYELLALLDDLFTLSFLQGDFNLLLLLLLLILTA